METSAWRVVVLADNGSVKPYAPLMTRKLAQQLQEEIGVKTIPASLAHSGRIPVDRLNGQPVALVKPLLQELSMSGIEEVIILPFMLASGGAIHRKLAAEVEIASNSFAETKFELAQAILSDSDQNPHPIVPMFVEHIESTIQEKSLDRPRVILVDHGSPRRESADLRNSVGKQLKDSLGERIEGLIAASMERRPGAEYDFNEPMLKKVLEESAEERKTIVLARLFLQPGKHSGKKGDVDEICEEVFRRFPEFEIHHAPRVFLQKNLIHLLKIRYKEITKLQQSPSDQ